MGYIALYLSHPFFTSHLILAVHVFSFPYPTSCVPVSKRHLNASQPRPNVRYAYQSRYVSGFSDTLVICMNVSNAYHYSIRIGYAIRYHPGLSAHHIFLKLYVTWVIFGLLSLELFYVRTIHIRCSNLIDLHIIYICNVL
jgi:hypothetical protein